MTNTIQVKRGANASLPILAQGEFGFSTDTKQLHIGDGVANHEVLMHDKFDAGTLLYAETDNTPVAKTRAELMALLSGQVGVDFSMNSKKITNVSDPSSAQDVATKAYVDAYIQGLDVKASCRAATTANITLSGAQTIDGVSIVAGDRVLVKDQITGSENGIYVCQTEAWTRATDFDADAEVTAGAFAFIEEGTINGDGGFVLTTDSPIIVGTTALTFTQFSGAGAITAGAGLTKTGTELNVGAGTGIQVNADTVEVKYGSAAGTACQGNDSRLSDARTPIAHKATHVTGGSDVIDNAVSGGNAGLMTGADKQKLDGIESGATGDMTGAEIVTAINGSASLIDDDNIAATIARDSEVSAAISSHAGETASVHNFDASGKAPAQAHASSHVTGGSDVVPDAVPSGNAGLMTGADKAKLDGIESGATGDMTAAEMVAAINGSASIIDDDNIASTIARDSEVSAAVTNHADLATGVHGAGANTLLNSGSVIDGGAFA